MDRIGLEEEEKEEEDDDGAQVFILLWRGMGMILSRPPTAGLTPTLTASLRQGQNEDNMGWDI